MIRWDKETITSTGYPAFEGRDGFFGYRIESRNPGFTMLRIRSGTGKLLAVVTGLHDTPAAKRAAQAFVDAVRILGSEDVLDDDLARRLGYAVDRSDSEEDAYHALIHGMARDDLIRSVTRLDADGDYLDESDLIEGTDRLKSLAREIGVSGNPKPVKRRAVAPTKARRTVPAKKSGQSWTAYHDQLSALAAEARKAGDAAMAAKFGAKAGKVAADHPTVMSRARKGKRSGPGTYPWKQCMEDQRKRSPKLSEKRRAAICGAIRARSRKAYPDYWKARGAKKNPATMPPLTEWDFNAGSGEIVPHFVLSGTHGTYHFIAETGRLQFVDKNGRFHVLSKRLDVEDVPGAVESHVVTGSLPGVVRATARRAMGRDVYTGRARPGTKRAVRGKKDMTKKNPARAGKAHHRRDIILPQELAVKVLEWHGGQGTQSYSLGSVGMDDYVSTAMIEAAVDELSRDLGARSRLSKKDQRELGELVAELDTIAHFPDEYTTKEAGLGDVDSGYSTWLMEEDNPITDGRKLIARALKKLADFQIEALGGSHNAQIIAEGLWEETDLANMAWSDREDYLVGHLVAIAESRLRRPRGGAGPKENPSDLDGFAGAIYQEAKWNETASIASMRSARHTKDPNEQMSHLLDSFAYAIVGYYRASDIRESILAKRLYKNAQQARAAIFIKCGFPKERWIGEPDESGPHHGSASRYALREIHGLTGAPSENPSKKQHAAFAKKALASAKRELKTAMGPGHASKRMQHALNAFAEAVRAYWNAVDAKDQKGQAEAMELAGGARNLARSAAGLKPVAFIYGSKPIKAKSVGKKLAKKAKAKANPRAKSALRSVMKL